MLDLVGNPKDRFFPVMFHMYSPKFEIKYVSVVAICMYLFLIMICRLPQLPYSSHP